MEFKRLWKRLVYKIKYGELWDDIINFPYRTQYRIWHICSWLPILWRDQDWDFAYLLIVMRYKIQRMRRRQETARVISDWKKVATQMKKAEDILTRLIDDEYGMKGYLIIRKKYPKPPMHEWRNVPGGMIEHPKSSPAEIKELRKNWKIEKDTRDADLKELGRIFLEEVLGWWD